MSFEQIYADIKRKNYSPIYFLMGEEGYFIDKISDAIENGVLTEEEKAFNQLVIYGNREVEVGEIITMAKRYPMMSPYQVILVKEAQNLRNIEDLSVYVDNPLSTTILVICYRGKTLDKRKSLAKKLSKSFVLFESNKLYENQVVKWVENSLKEHNYDIDAKATAMLVEFLGTDLSKINNAFNKLMLVLPKGTKITPSHIEENIGISKDFNNFELQKAIGNRDIAKTLQIVRYFEENPKSNPFVLTISVLYNFFVKLFLLHCSPKGIADNSLAQKLGIHPFFLKEYRVAARNYPPNRITKIIELLRIYDMKSKGVDNISTSNGQLLHELVFKIFY